MSSSDLDVRHQAPHLSGLLRQIWPIVSIVVGLMAAAEVWYLSGPPLPSSGLATDEELVMEQINRAETLPDVDVLMTGDSSGLFDLDAVLLGRLMGGCRVESLATIGFVGPVGYADILRRFFERGRTTSTLVILIHAATLRQEPSWSAWQDFVRAGGRARKPPLLGAGDKILHDVIYRVLFFPLKGTYGAYYGSAERFRAFVRDNAGTAVSPANAHAARDIGGGTYVFESSQLWRDELGALGEAIASYSPERVFIAFTPLPRSLYAEKTDWTRAAELDATRMGLGLSENSLLPLPALMDDVDFANPFYLNETGREHYTEVFADQLIGRSSCAGA